MGWCSGTDIYAPVATKILSAHMADTEKERLLITLIDALHNHDWDCEELVTDDPIEATVFRRRVWVNDEI